ncbi:MAG: hypothetical protein MJ188_03170 [Treponema sp.]|nr:hypothetical protein [Treponema sp.]
MKKLSFDIVLFLFSSIVFSACSFITNDIYATVYKQIEQWDNSYISSIKQSEYSSYTLKHILISISDKNDNLYFESSIHTQDKASEIKTQSKCLIIPQGSTILIKEAVFDDIIYQPSDITLSIFDESSLIQETKSNTMSISENLFFNNRQYFLKINCENKKELNEVTILIKPQM